MHGRKIERSDGRGFGLPQLLANSIENSFHIKNKIVSSQPDTYKALKPY